jgi:predicted NodU family carbamoyl transferase
MKETDLNRGQVAFSGGVCHNVTLLGMAVAQLRTAGFAVFTHRAAPPNHGGLAFGQAVIANFAPAPKQREHGGPDAIDAIIAVGKCVRPGVHRLKDAVQGA